MKAEITSSSPRTKEIVSLAKKLIRFATVEENREVIHFCADFVEDYFANLPGINIKRHFCNGVPSMVVSNHKGTSFDVMLNGHLDVVPAKKSQFMPRVVEGKLYGRGASDMKASVATMMVVMKSLVANPVNNTKVGLMIVFDEEVGGFNGTRYLVEEKGYSAEVVIVPDDMGNLDLTNKEKGMVGLDVAFSGVAAHSCEPWQGESAVDNMLRFAVELRKQFPVRAKEGWVNTCNIGPVSSNHPRNQLADKTELSLDIRYTEKSDPESIIADVVSLAGKHKGDVKVVHQAPVVFTSVQHPTVRLFKKVAESSLGRPMKIVGDHGGSDARFFVPLDIPIIMCKPVSGNMHAEDEWVDVDSLGTFFEIINQFCISFAQSKKM